MIRHATPKDIPRLIELGHAGFKNVNKPVTRSEEKWRQTVEYMLLRPWQSVVLIGDRGFLLGQLVDYPFADANYAIDVAFYSEGGDGMQFIEAFTKWAKSKGAVQVVIANSSGIERTDQFLEKAGFIRTGGMFARTL